MSRSKDRGPLDISGEERSYRCFRIEGSELCNFNFFSFASQSSINTHSNGKYCCPFIFGKNGRYLTQISDGFEQGNYLLSKEITITAKYLPGLLNVETDTQSRTVRDANKWKLNTRIFQKICKHRGTPDIDLFASRISHQLPTYISWKLDPYSQGRDAFQISWTNKNGMPFPHFV